MIFGIRTITGFLYAKRVAMDTLGHGRACLTCWYCRQGQYKQCLDMYPVQGGGFAQFIKRKAAGWQPVTSWTRWACQSASKRATDWRWSSASALPLAARLPEAARKNRL
jgi:hypothetical protein